MSKFKRKQKKAAPTKTSAILSADWHLRESTPRCRTDDFWAAQEKKIDFIFDLARKKDCPILIAGDIGDKPRWSCRLLEWFISKIDKSNIKIFATVGQHDLINHNLALWEHSGVGVLYAAGAIELLGPHDLQSDWAFDNFHLDAFPYEEELHHMKALKGPAKNLIAMSHQMVIENQKLWPGQNAPEGHSLLKKFPEYNLILTGDNHLPFVAEYKGRLLVNPGSMMRTTAGQANHNPRVYLWYAESNTVEAVHLPIEEDVISREHIEIAVERSDRMKAFITRVKEDVEIILSYEKNIESYFRKFRTLKRVIEKTWEAVNG